MARGKERHIIHVNPDDYYASILRNLDRGLRKRPVIVGYPSNRGGVVSASYEAREEGVCPGLSVSRATRLCPSAIFVPVDWRLFNRVSDELFRILNRFSPLVEKSALDEAYIDYTGSGRLFGAPADFSMRLKERIKEQLGLDASIGLAKNKLVSRAASSVAKRDKMLEVFPGYEGTFLAPLPLTRLPEVDDPTAAHFRDLGIERIGDLRRFPGDLLTRAFGILGERLKDWRWGIDRTPVKRISKEECLEETRVLETDTVEKRVLEYEAAQLSESAGKRLRSEKRTALKGDLTIVYADFMQARRCFRFSEATDLDGEIYEAAVNALWKAFSRRVRIRQMSIRLSGLRYGGFQGDLFSLGDRQKKRTLCFTVDEIRKKYGDGKSRLIGWGRSFMH